LGTGKEAVCRRGKRTGKRGGVSCRKGKASYTFMHRRGDETVTWGTDVFWSSEGML